MLITRVEENILKRMLYLIQIIYNANKTWNSEIRKLDSPYCWEYQLRWLSLACCGKWSFSGLLWKGENSSSEWLLSFVGFSIYSVNGLIDGFHNFFT